MKKILGWLGVPGLVRVMDRATKALPVLKYAWFAVLTLVVCAHILRVGATAKSLLEAGVAIAILTVLAIVLTKLAAMKSRSLRWAATAILWLTVLVVFGIALKWLADFWGLTGGTTKPDLTALMQDAVEIDERQLVHQISGPAMANKMLVFSDVLWDRKNRVLDVKVRNDGTEAAIISEMTFELRFHPEQHVPIPVSARLPLIETNAPTASSNLQFKPYHLLRGFKTSYAVPPKGVDRYQFAFSLLPENLTFPLSPRSGEYALSISFAFNADRTATKVSLMELTNGLFFARK